MPSKKRGNRKKKSIAKQPASPKPDNSVRNSVDNNSSLNTTPSSSGNEKLIDELKIKETSVKLPDFIQTSIDNAVGARAIDIDNIISSISQKVTNGDYIEKSKLTTAPPAENVDSEGSIKLPDFIQTCIDNAVGARAIDIDNIITSISQKVTNGDYIEKSKLTATTEQTPASPAEKVDSMDSIELPDFIHTCINNAVGARAIEIDDIISSISQNVTNGDYIETPKPTTEPTTAPLTGSIELPAFIRTSIDNAVGARTIDMDDIISSISQKVTNGDYEQKTSDAKDTSVTIKEGSATTKSVEHCIQSVVQSTVVDAYTISRSGRAETEETNKPVEQPPQQPKERKQVQRSATEPTQRKTSDNVQRKVKSAERKKSSHKKKDCIIL